TTPPPTGGAPTPPDGDAPAAPSTEPVAPVTPAMAHGLEGGQLVTGTVQAIDEHEVEVALEGGLIGVIARRHLGTDAEADPAAVLPVGSEVQGAVLVRDDPRGRVVLSRDWARKLHAWEALESARATGAELDAPVTGTVKGGLVLDVGVRAFMPASLIEHEPARELKRYVGQTLTAVVVEADRENDRVVLSRRAVLRRRERRASDDLVKSLEPGQTRKGRVATLTDFGAFVDLGGVRGLLHLSEMAWERVSRPDEVVRVGQEIEVKVLAVRKDGKRISLSLRETMPDPFRSLEVGETLQGVVTRLVDFGAFVRVGEGAEGLVHLSELAEYRVNLPEEVVAPGDEVLVKVIGLDRKRRRLDLSVIQAVQY
ncbi:MAG: S1 RNA-binding domain-containing protein, partial [Actinomycetota bacterium]|nr:S1 RNA-binding domain-containing protein [Actinomycetota bacterium]